MNFQFNRVLITGAAGFIGFHLSMRLLKNGKKRVVLPHQFRLTHNSVVDCICLSQIFKRFNFLHESREHRFSAKSN